MAKLQMLIITIFALFLTTSLSAYESLSFSQVDREGVNKSKIGDLDEDYFTVKRVKIRKIEEKKIIPGTGGSTGGSTGGGTLGEIGRVVSTIDRIIAVGKKLWDIFKENKPVVTANLKPISVIPNLDDPTAAFHEMAGWSLPEAHRYEVVFENALGNDVVKFQFMVIYQHSGTYEDKGKYITGLNIIPSSVSVMWSYKLDVNSELVSISNMGTRDDVLASATLHLKYSVKSMIKQIDTSIIFHVMGDGRIVKM